MTHIVHWSGGADSTLILTHVADAHGHALAVTVKHPQLEAAQAKKEHQARQQYKAWARKKGLHIDHRIIDIRTKATAYDGQGQAGLWLLGTGFCVHPGDSVHFGYIRTDDFWHTRAAHDAAFYALMKHGLCSDVKLFYPLEWHHKVDVLRGLRKWRIPQRCWWTCDTPTTKGRACGRCTKCITLRHAKSDLATSVKSRLFGAPDKQVDVGYRALVAKDGMRYSDGEDLAKALMGDSKELMEDLEKG